MEFIPTNDGPGKREIRIQPMKSNVSEEKEETNWSRKRKNEKHPGSQRGGSGKNGKQKGKIAMQKLRVESTKPMKVKHIE